MTGKDGWMIRAKKLFLQNRDNQDDLIDIGMVGDITQIDLRLISHLEAGTFIWSSRRSVSARMAKPTTSMPTSSPARSPKSSAPKNWCC